PAAPADPKRLLGITSGNLEIAGRRIYRSQRADRFAGLDGMRCPGVDYPKVLTGKAHFTVYGRCLPWDHLPGIMLLREAGWVDRHLDGSTYDVADLVGGVMSAPGRDLLDEIVRRLTT
ncbi:MAG TPA: inositol monophosphatase family protein, partial [Hyphomicrobiaceae bacterium]|nr:inositol monophosphatase family protein [Hyphomicrobiaceae bacterium]